MSRTFKQLLVLTGLFALTACQDTNFPEGMAGTYVATEFTITIGNVVDVLAAGGSLEITLNHNGTTTGSLLIPVSVLEPGETNPSGDFTADLAGTWRFVGDSLFFIQEADTFVRDQAWEGDGNGFWLRFTKGTTEIFVYLSRQ
ncbi:MAG: hypothetical protein OEZ54_09235 [Gemmatimonadota bacterium]|nr:hypothetical protein [Gemmatimonadota bacterium]